MHDEKMLKRWNCVISFEYVCVSVCVWPHICGNRPWGADLIRMSFFTAENDMLLMLVSVCVCV